MSDATRPDPAANSWLMGPSPKAANVRAAIVAGGTLLTSTLAWVASVLLNHA